MTLELLLHPSGTSTNITTLYDPISYIPYIYQVPSTYPTEDQFPMDSRRKIYVVSIDNEHPSLAYYDVQLLRDKQKRAISAYMIFTLDRRHPYELTSLEEHRAFFDQLHTLLEPTILHHEVFQQ